MNQIQTSALFSKNRAEELGHDVWQHFVIPPFFERLDIYTAKKPRVVIAGRGCGKTMLLRYLSHQSAFSPHREVIPNSALAHIGLYWRADTQFAQAMSKRDIPDDVWESAFNHLLAIVLGIELLQSLGSIARSRAEAICENDLTALDFARIARSFDETLGADYHSLLQSLEDRLWSFQAWVNDVRQAKRPTFLPGRGFLLALIKVVKSQLPALGAAGFFVYLDEYENLLPYQKTIVHTCLKHSEAAEGLIFNLAVKRGVLDAPHVVGSEALLNIHDWRTHDLEQYLLDANFPLFAAEILFLQLSLAGAGIELPIDPSTLRDPGRISTRRTRSYSTRVLSSVKQLFPSLSHQQLAYDVLRDEPLRSKLISKITRALAKRGSTLDARQFISDRYPQATVIVPALLHRTRLSAEQVLTEIEKLESDDPANRFTGKADWLNNYFVGCLLQLYGPYSRACPFYAGFDTFCDLAHGSMRHMLELCHQAINKSDAYATNAVLRATPVEQATAAHLASALFLDEIRKFGPWGIQLHGFVLRLGSLFALAQDRPSQSQAEITHFSIDRGSINFTFDDQLFLGEAVKWSVLFREKTTKRHAVTEPQAEEYVLNPIYAPYFHISYRKKTKLALPTEHLIILMRGDYDSFRSLLGDFSRKWSVDLSDRPTLFAHLESSV